MPATIHPTVAAVLEQLPEEHRKAALAALTSGDAWTLEPESAVSNDARPYRCADRYGEACEREWHREYLEPGFEVEFGALIHVCWTCDEDGNWDRTDDMPVENALYPSWVENRFGAATRDAEWRAYHEFVADTGTDPLGEFLFVAGAGPTREDTRWEVEFAEVRDAAGTPTGVTVRRARKDGEEVWRQPADLPEAVRQYLLLDVTPQGWRMDPGGLRSLDDLRALDAVTWAGVVEAPTEATGWVTVTLQVERPEAEVAAELRRRAREVLSRPTTPMTPEVDAEEWRAAGQLPGQEGS